MKKTLMAVGGFLALGVLCYVGRSSGQQPQPGIPQQSAVAAAEPQSRIALLNLTFVIKNYNRFLAFQEDIKKLQKPFMDADAALRQQMENLRKQYETPPVPGQAIDRLAIERRGTDIKRQLEDNNALAKAKLGAKSDEEMQLLFTDVFTAAKGYATSHGFDIVLQFNDAVTYDDWKSPQNIARKLNTGALMPLIYPDKMDISKDIVALLNSNCPAPTSTPAAPPGTSGGQH